MLGALVGIVAVLVPMVGATLGVAIGINKTLQDIAKKLDEIDRQLAKE